MMAFMFMWNSVGLDNSDGKQWDGGWQRMNGKWHRMNGRYPRRMVPAFSAMAEGVRHQFREDRIPQRLKNAYRTGVVRLERMYLAGMNQVDNASRAAAAEADILIFVPGMDGTGLTIMPQLLGLAQKYQVFSLVIPRADRSHWDELLTRIEVEVERVLKESSRRQAVFVGESMGAVVLTLFLSRRPDLAASATLVNPATAEADEADVISPWLSVTQLPDELFPIVRFLAAPLVQDSSHPEPFLGPFRKVVQSLETLPQDTVAHRLRLLQESRRMLSDRVISSIHVPVAIVAAANDRLIPSYRESERLLKLFPKTMRLSKLVGGHAMLQNEDKFSLAQVLDTFDKFCAAGVCREITLDRQNLTDVKALKEYSYTELDSVQSRLDGLRRLVSPVFVGMERIPASGEKPILFVGNHVLLGFTDGPLLVDHMFQTRKILVRALAHPILFEGTPRETGGPPAFSVTGVPIIGAVGVSPRSLFSLLRQNQHILLYPGGARGKSGTPTRFTNHEPHVSLLFEP